MPKACQPPPPRPIQNTRPAERSGAERCPARSDCRLLQPTRRQLETTSLIYVSAKCCSFGSHEIPGISVNCKLFLAEGEGFEPTLGLLLSLISSQVPSTTQPPFRKCSKDSIRCVFDKYIVRAFASGASSFAMPAGRNPALISSQPGLFVSGANVFQLAQSAGAPTFFA